MAKKIFLLLCKPQSATSNDSHDKVLPVPNPIIYNLLIDYLSATVSNKFYNNITYYNHDKNLKIAYLFFYDYIKCRMKRKK